MRPYERLHARWREHGYSGGRIYKDVHGPLEVCGFPFPDEAMLLAIELEFDAKIPTDLREHLLHVPLTGEGVDGGELVLFWSADQVTSIANKYAESRFVREWQRPDRAETYLIFCDYMISAWEWAVQCEPGNDYGKIALVSRDSDKWFVYGSFGEMVEDYIAKDWLDFTHQWNRTRK